MKPRSKNCGFIGLLFFVLPERFLDTFPHFLRIDNRFIDYGVDFVQDMNLKLAESHKAPPQASF